MDELIKRENTGIVKHDPNKVLADNTQPAIFKEVKSVELAISDKFQSLAQIKGAYGEKLPLAIIKVWIVNLNDFLNIQRKMTPVQIEETAGLIYDEFYFLKTSDIALIFQRVKTGYYGQFYESIDGMKIMDIFYKYGQERVNHFIESGFREHQETKRF